jgi:hypothetical protein
MTAILSTKLRDNVIPGQEVLVAKSDDPREPKALTHLNASDSLRNVSLAFVWRLAAVILRQIAMALLPQLCEMSRTTAEPLMAHAAPRSRLAHAGAAQDGGHVASLLRCMRSRRAAEDSF